MLLAPSRKQPLDPLPLSEKVIRDQCPVCPVIPSKVVDPEGGRVELPNASNRLEPRARPGGESAEAVRTAEHPKCVDLLDGPSPVGR